MALSGRGQTGGQDGDGLISGLTLETVTRR
jgi:hypothetical protein